MPPASQPSPSSPENSPHLNLPDSSRTVVIPSHLSLVFLLVCRLHYISSSPSCTLQPPLPFWFLILPPCILCATCLCHAVGFEFFSFIFIRSLPAPEANIAQTLRNHPRRPPSLPGILALLYFFLWLPRVSGEGSTPPILSPLPPPFSVFPVVPPISHGQHCHNRYYDSPMVPNVSSYAPDGFLGFTLNTSDPRSPGPTPFFTILRFAPHPS